MSSFRPASDRLTAAQARLETALARLESAVASRMADGAEHDDLAGRLKAAEEECAALRETTRVVSARLDEAIGRLRAAIEA